MTKNRKIQLALIALALFILTSFATQQTKGSIITVRTIEVANGIWDSKICIVYEDGRTEDIELQKFRDHTFNPNSVKISEVLNRLNGKGYKLISASSGNGDAVLTNTFLFQKQCVDAEEGKGFTYVVMVRFEGLSVQLRDLC